MLHKIDSTQKPSLYSDVRNLNVSQSKTRYIRKRDLAMGFSDFSVPMISVVASSVRMSKPLQVSQCKFSHLTLLTVGLYSRPRTPSTAIQQILSLRCTPTITAASRNYNNIAECRCRQHLRALASRRAMHQSTRLPQCVAASVRRISCCCSSSYHYCTGRLADSTQAARHRPTHAGKATCILSTAERWTLMLVN